MQWNARGMIGKWAEVKPVLVDKAHDVICIQETHFLPTDNYDFRLHDYTLYNGYSNADRRQGGVCIYVGNRHPHFQVQLTTPFQTVACSVKVGRHRFFICSLYLPPTDPLTYRDLYDLVAQLPRPFIICTDANSRHLMWGADRCDSRGNTWERVIRQFALNVLNDGQPTRLDEYTGLWSHIDLTLSSSCLGPYMQWDTDTDLYSSDHCPIYIHCDINEPAIPHGFDFFGWNIYKANWVEFSEKCNLRFIPEHGLGNYATITAAMLEAADVSVPKKNGRSKYNCPWWNDDCKEALRLRDRALNRFRRSHLTAHLMDYKAAKAKARRTIRKAKRDSWEKLLHMFQHSTPMRQLWDIIRRFTKKERFQRPLPVLNIDGTVIDDPKEVADVLGKFFSDMSSSLHYRPIFRARERDMTDRLPSFASPNDETYNVIFTLEELKRSILLCGDTSIGPDKIHYAFFKHLNDSQLSVVLDMINYVWCTERIPDEWKHSVMIPILKPGKPPDQPASYRPIQLTSCFSKVMERMIAHRLSWYVETTDMLSNVQCAFRKGRNTTDHLLRLESEVRQGFFYNKYTLAVFLDLKNAYNLTSKVALLTKMYHLGFRGRLMSFISSYLNGRTFQVRSGCLSDTFEQENGLVQGGVISPILFNLMINDIFDNVPGNPSCALFADDCSMWVQGRRILPLIERMQLALNHISMWADNWGFIFSPPKCNALIFRRYMKASELRNLPDLTIYDQPVTYADEVKFLGVLLDARLNLNKHIQYVKGKAVKRISILRCLAGRNCGADRSVLIRIYKSMIRPILDYACIILDGPNNTVVESLDSIQNECLRIATGALRTSPILPLLVECDVLPLRLRRCDLTLRYCLKVSSTPGHPCRPLLSDDSALHTVNRDYMKRISGFPLYERFTSMCQETGFDFPPALTTQCCSTPPWMLRRCEFLRLTHERKCTLTDRQVQYEFHEFQAKYAEFVFVFTDGSKTAGGVGCAYVHGERCEGFKLPAQCSVFTAEAVAIYQALLYVTENLIPKCVISTDSLSVFSALQSSSSSHPTVIDILEASHQLLESGCELIFLWVPGHCGITGNDMADIQAKGAIQSNRRLDVVVGPKEYHCTLHLAIRNLFSQFWHAYSPHTTLKLVKEEVGQWDTCNRKNRREEVVLCRMRLGHTRYTHGYLLDREPRPECDSCACPRSVNHLLIECPVFEDQRLSLTTLCGERDLPLCLKSLLGDEHPDVIDEVFGFLRACDLMKKL